jgi:hypothetical protein
LGKSVAACHRRSLLSILTVCRLTGFDEATVDRRPGCERLAHGTVEFRTNYAPNFITAIDRGEPITLLTGVMVGCYALFGNEETRNITDLKGKTAGKPWANRSRPGESDGG